MNKFFFVFLCFLISCKKNIKADWVSEIDGVTSASSPMLADLNADGIDDVVIGAGADEWQATPSGVIALDGANGDVLWKAAARNQIVGSAVFSDLNADGTLDVIIGGRSAELQALNGRNGKVLWQFYKGSNQESPSRQGWFNFYNPQILADQNADKIPDLLICNGGDASLPPGVKNRPTGKLLVISGKTGEILQAGLMPDGQETYFSPVLLSEGNDPEIIFGSGGETLPGHLYLSKLSDLKKNSLQNSLVLDSSQGKGFVAPPVLADFNEDKVLDILVSTAEGLIKLIDGKTKKALWQVKNDNAEIYSQAAVGNFLKNDTSPDVFVQVARGYYPAYTGIELLVIDGKTGKISKRYSEKYFTYCSPLVVDLENDGQDEVLLQMVTDTLISGKTRPLSTHKVFDFSKNKSYAFLPSEANMACFASTPSISDAEHKGVFSIIRANSPATSPFFPGGTIFEKPKLALKIEKTSLHSFKNLNVKWGNYMGKEGKSVVR
jgi:hypothetical protein